MRCDCRQNDNIIMARIVALDPRELTSERSSLRLSTLLHIAYFCKNNLHYISSGVAWVFFLVRQFARGGPEIKKNGRLKRIFPSLIGYFMISIITEITRRKLFRYASNDCVCEFISEPWEWLHEASSRVSDGIYICNRKKSEKIK